MFLGGAVDLPMTAAQVYTVYPSQEISFVVGAAAGPVGRVTADRMTGIAGRLGESAPMVPLAIQIRQPGRDERRFQFEVIDNRFFLGQFLGLLTNHSLARAHVQVATSVGYWPWEHAPFKYLAWWFWRVHGPLMLAIKGYVPTGGGWTGLPLPRGVYEEWRRWCLRPTHFGPDLQTYLADNVFGKIRAPVLNVGFSDDSIATRRTVDELDRFFPHVERESRWYTPADVGGRIGHEGFFHSRHRETLWRPTLDWLNSRLGLSA